MIMLVMMLNMMMYAHHDDAEQTDFVRLGTTREIPENSFLPLRSSVAHHSWGSRWSGVITFLLADPPDLPPWPNACRSMHVAQML